MTATAAEKVARGAAWMVGLRMTDRLVGLASTLILARVLTPADFGLVAMAMAVIGLIELASAFGFEVPLLRAAQPTRAEYDTVWTLNVMFGVGCASATALAAVPAAHFYAEERLIPVFLALAFGWAVSSFANVGTVDFRRNLDFAREFRLLMANRVVTFSVTIPSALLFRSYWALIAGIVAGRIASVAFSYLWHPYRPRFSLRESRQLFSFSLWIFVEKIASFGNARLPDFVLGRTHGPAAVGVYRVAEEIGYLPGSELVAPINRVFLPGVSRLVEGGRTMGEVVAIATGVVALILFPACLGIAAVADPLVRTMLGNQWLGAIPIVEIMAVNAMLVALWSNQQTSLLAAGLPKLPGLVALARLAVFAPSVFLLTPAYGSWGVAVSVLISSTFSFLIGLQVSLRKLAMTLGQYLGATWRPLLASSIMYGVLRHTVVATGSTQSSLQALGELGTAVAAGVGVYVAALAALYFGTGRPRGAEQIVLGRLQVLVRRRKASA